MLCPGQMAKKKKKGIATSPDSGLAVAKSKGGTRIERGWDTYRERESFMNG
jgi:hypothetical protein